MKEGKVCDKCDQSICMQERALAFTVGANGRSCDCPSSHEKLGGNTEPKQIFEGATFQHAVFSSVLDERGKLDSTNVLRHLGHSFFPC